MPIYCLKGSGPYNRVEGCRILVLHSRKDCSPGGGLIASEAAQVILEVPVDHFSIADCLGGDM